MPLTSAAAQYSVRIHHMAPVAGHMWWPHIRCAFCGPQHWATCYVAVWLTLALWLAMQDSCRQAAVYVDIGVSQPLLVVECLTWHCSKHCTCASDTVERHCPWTIGCTSCRACTCWCAEAIGSFSASAVGVLSCGCSVGVLVQSAGLCPQFPSWMLNANSVPAAWYMRLLTCVPT